MNARLLSLLCCPICGSDLALAPVNGGGQEAAESLQCHCGATYAIRGGIPRIVVMDRGVPHRFLSVQQRTQRSFGRQWQYFSKMNDEFYPDLFRYLGAVDERFFQGKLGLDVGCGFGRHAYYANRLGAEMVAVDFSQAIESASRNLRECRGIHLVQANLYRLPFRSGTFDFVYSLGVLHHLPDPEAGFRALVPLLKPGGVIIIWVYSSTRRWINRALELVRRVTTRLPASAVRVISLAAAMVDYGGFVLPYQWLSALPGIGPRIDQVAWKRLKLYSRYPFNVAWADWFDRLAAPYRAYYDAPTLERWLAEACLTNVQITPTGDYGWRAHGQAPADHYPGS